MEKEKITSGQAIAVMTGFLMGTAVLLNPSVANGSDAWFAMLVSGIGGLLIICITGCLAVLHPGKSLTQITIFCFGRIAGSAIGFFYLLYAVWLSGAVISTYSYFDITVDYPETPVWFVTICYSMVVAYAVRLGLETMGRIGEVLTIMFAAITVLTFFSYFESFHIDNFLPLFKDGAARPIINGLIGSTLPYGEIFLVLNFLPNINDQKKVFGATAKAGVFTGILLFLMVTRNVGVLGSELAARNVFPSEKVFRLMPGANVLPLLEVNVAVSGVIKSCVSLYSQIRIAGDIFGLKNFKVLVLPFAVLDVIVALIFSNSIFEDLFAIQHIVPLLYIPILVLMPLLMLTISLIKQPKAKKGKNSTAGPDPDIR